MRWQRPLSRWSCALIATATTAFALGCTEEGSAVDQGEPTLTIVASNACGRNVLPVTTVDEVAAGSFQAVDIVVTGTDPASDSREMLPGTPVQISIAEGSDGRGFFVSSRTPSGDSFSFQDTSRDVDFLGRSARDQFFCISLGTVSLTATVTDYPSATAGEIIPSITPFRNFPIRCVGREEFLRECGILDASVPLPDAGIEDMGVDAGDLGPDMAPIINPWTVSFVPFDDAGDAVISIRGSGGGRPDNLVLRFKVTEADRPVADVPVAFRLSGLRPGDAPPGGIVVLPEPDRDDIRAASNSADLRNELYVTTTNSDGVASVRVVAGGSPGTLAIQAIGYRGIDDVDTESDTSTAVTIRGGIPSGRGMQITCDEEVIPAFTQRELLDPENPDLGDRYLLGNQEGTTCRVQLADRVNGRLDRQTRVFFMTEAGTVDQESGIDEDGGALTVMRVGLPAPREVEPDDNWERPFINEFQGRFNPRDGLVRVVAYTRGEEDFRDTNGNKIYDAAFDVLEPGMDLGEPFIDADDDADFTLRLPSVGGEDVSEEFRDTDGDDNWTPPNFAWDQSTEIWTSTTVLWTGNLRSDLEPGFSDDPMAPAAVSVVCAPGGVTEIRGRFIDSNGNCLGGRAQGEVTLGLETGLTATGVAQARIAGQWCWAGFERPRAKEFLWNVLNEGEEPAEISIDLNYLGVGDVSYERRWTLLSCN